MSFKNPYEITDISIDLETLDISPRSLILSIGVVPFNRYSGFTGRGVKYHTSILSQPCRTMSMDTIQWWFKQTKEAKSKVLKGQLSATSLYRSLIHMSWYMSRICDLSKVRVWGNGASFDNAILSDAYKNSLKTDVPWKFWNDRDIRTLLGDHKERTGIDLKKTVPFVGERHSALEDARHQAKLVIKASK